MRLSKRQNIFFFKICGPPASRNVLTLKKHFLMLVILFFQQATKEDDKAIVNASFHVTHWIISPFGTGLSRVKNVSCVFGGDVIRFLHAGDECLTVPPNFSLDTPETKLVIMISIH